MSRALGEFMIEGVKTTVPLGQAIMNNPCSSAVFTIRRFWIIF